ncbi:MAG: 4'-phosphopantetheinyl transferase superfamily protein [Verrucomicrobia bacterium]|nr:4'-phosphopantetheinyl transferase superfamily protein [Verrucomicrobiota bacterium]
MTFTPLVGPLSAGLKLDESDIHIWYAQLDLAPECVVALTSRLPEDEQNRAHRFSFDRDRVRFVVCRQLLRVLLGRYLGVPAAELRFRFSGKGKPYLPGQELHFNLAHSGGAALIALARLQPLGIDLEQIRLIPDADSLVERFFSQAERLAFQSLPETLKMKAFFTCWTRKEAFLKATGEGLSFPLSDFTVTFLPDEPVRISNVRSAADFASSWSLYHLEPEEGFVGALAIPGNQWHLTARTLSVEQWAGELLPGSR